MFFQFDWYNFQTSSYHVYHTDSTISRFNAHTNAFELWNVGKKSWNTFVYDCTCLIVMITRRTPTQIQHDDGWWRHVKPSFESGGRPFVVRVRVQLHAPRTGITVEADNSGIGACTTAIFKAKQPGLPAGVLLYLPRRSWFHCLYDRWFFADARGVRIRVFLVRRRAIIYPINHCRLLWCVGS